MSVGKNLEYWRKARGLSRNGLAKRAGMTHTQVGNIEKETSSPTVETLEKLASALNIPVVYLVSNDNGDTKSPLTELLKTLPDNAQEEVKRFILFKHNEYNDKAATREKRSAVRMIPQMGGGSDEEDELFIIGSSIYEFSLELAA